MSVWDSIYGSGWFLVGGSWIEWDATRLYRGYNKIYDNYNNIFSLIYDDCFFKTTL